MNKVSFRLTFAEALEIGVKNAPSIIGCVVLWLLTIWVPYINVGTTIAINMLPIELAKGGVISPLGIFDAKYRKYMGDFLITTGLMIIPVFIASLFMIVPGIVLSIAWSLAYFFLFEKKKNPMQAISASNEATYGSKWTMFFVLLAFVVAAYVIAGIFAWICAAIDVGFIIFVVLLAFVVAAYVIAGIFAWICAAIDVGFIIFVVLLALVAVIMSISLAINASFWRQLKDNVQ